MGQNKEEREIGPRLYQNEGWLAKTGFCPTFFPYAWCCSNYKWPAILQSLHHSFTEQLASYLHDCLDLQFDLPLVCSVLCFAGQIDRVTIETAARPNTILGEGETISIIFDVYGYRNSYRGPLTLSVFSSNNTLLSTLHKTHLGNELSLPVQMHKNKARSPVIKLTASVSNNVSSARTMTTTPIVGKTIK